MIWLVETQESGEWRPTAQNWPNRKMARAHAKVLRGKGYATRVRSALIVEMRRNLPWWLK